MPIDQIGNPLLVGDLVVIKVGSESLIAHVKEVKEAGILAPGPSQMQMPGQLMLAIPYTVLFDVKNPICQHVTKVVKPPNYNKKAD